MSDHNEFMKRNKAVIDSMGIDKDLEEKTKDWFLAANNKEYSYHFSWMGRPIIQYPQDVVAMQEIMWDVKPDLIIETGIARGGSLVMYASFMEMMGIENGHVLGIDIDIREHNRIEIESHPMARRISMLQGSSTDKNIVDQVKEYAKNYNTILVILDSNHTHEHVAKELELYSGLVSVGSYCVVFDTVVEDMPENSFPNRPWDKGDNPKTAVWEFISKNDNFIINKDIQNKILITVAPDGYLKRVK